jgi:hypothetical protein
LLGDRLRALDLLERVAGLFRGDRSGWTRDPDLALREEPRFRRRVAEAGGAAP